MELKKQISILIKSLEITNTYNNSIKLDDVEDDNDQNHIRNTTRNAIITVANDSNDVNNDINILETQLSHADGVVIICGSAFIMAEVRAELGIILL